MDGAGRARAMGVRRFGRVNWRGAWTLAGREVRRFTAIWVQTLAAPVLTAALFLAVFALAIGPGRPEAMGRPYLDFLVPGLLMMTVIQNAFANTSSSLMVSKVQGNIVDTLMPPLSAAEVVAGYLAGGIARGLFVGAGMLAAGVPALGLGIAHPLWLLAFVVVGGALLAALGLLAAILTSKWDQMAAITNFVITPLSFLSGTFYPAAAAPEDLRWMLHANPMFHLIDGARYAMLGVSDGRPAPGLAIALAATAAATGLAWYWIRIGFRLKP
jgi:ABC-2 type transport system permease protein